MELNEYLNDILDSEHRAIFEHVLDWTKETFPELKLQMKWNQPMFIYNETFIIAFTSASKHMSVAPETAMLDLFINRIKEAGYEYSKKIFRIKYKDTIDYGLLKDIIVKSIELKKDYNRFWL